MNKKVKWGRQYTVLQKAILVSYGNDLSYVLRGRHHTFQDVMGAPGPMCSERRDNFQLGTDIE
jgi:hypothetical protein